MVASKFRRNRRHIYMCPQNAVKVTTGRIKNNLGSLAFAAGAKRPLLILPTLLFVWCLAAESRAAPQHLASDFPWFATFP